MTSDLQRIEQRLANGSRHHFNDMTPRTRFRSTLAGIWLLLALLAAGLAPPTAGQSMEHHQHQFSGADRWAAIFDDPARDEWQKPDEVVRALKLKPDSTIADIGAGTGYFSVRLARAVPKGHVYGVDAEPDMIHYLSERAQRENLTNLTAVLTKPDNPGVPVPVDVVMLVDTYHHIPDREKYFSALQKSFKVGGRLVIIDFTQQSPVGPSVRARILAGRVKQELEGAGYRLLEEHKFLPNQYFLVFRPLKYR